MFSEILAILTQFGAGPGDPENLSVRFLLAAFFWLSLLYISFSQWRNLSEERDRFIMIGALIGLLRELTMFFGEYSSLRGLIPHELTYQYYPPLEHTLTMLSSVFIAYAFIRYFLRNTFISKSYLVVGILSTFLLYLITFNTWISFLQQHPDTSFGAFWGDIVFRVNASILMSAALAILIYSKIKSNRIPLFLLLGILFLFLDEFLMIFNLATKEIHLAIYAPIRHNLHIWAIPLFIAVYWQDILVREKSEKDKNKAIISSIGDGVSIIDKDYIVVYQNLYHQQLLGSHVGELCFKAFEGNKTICTNCPMEKLFHDGRINRSERTNILNGLNLGLTVSPLRDIEGNIIAGIQVVRDLTEQKRTEEKIKQSQKMEAVGQLAGGIAHDFNNILTGILGYAEFSKKNVSKDSDLYNNLCEISKAGNRAADLVSQILAFSRQQDLKKEPIHLQKLIRETLQLIKRTLPTTINVQEDISNKCKPIFADTTQIHQVMMNLCTNAYHAMFQNGGVLTISLYEVYISRELSAELELETGKYARIRVSDTGHGMDNVTAKHIFEPFYTTKDKGVGTGMGLATTHGIVKSHNGAITVQSKPGHGTYFDVFFPVFVLEVDKTDEYEEIEPPPISSGNIMFVDDENMIVQLGENALKSIGYEVKAFTNSKDALEEFKLSPDWFDAVVTDQTMPNLTGLELTKQLHQIRPDLPVILCTGFSETVNEKIAKENGISQFLMKPLTIYDLSASINKAIGR